jgi:aconitate hydratase
LTGKITDPRDLETLLNISYPQWKEPAKIKIVKEMLIAKGRHNRIDKGPNIQSLPLFEALPDTLEVPILLKWEMIFLLMVF